MPTRFTLNMVPCRDEHDGHPPAVALGIFQLPLGVTNQGSERTGWDETKLSARQDWWHGRLARLHRKADDTAVNRRKKKTSSSDQTGPVPRLLDTGT